MFKLNFLIISLVLSGFASIYIHAVSEIEKSLFEEDYCNRKCDNITHSMCINKNLTPQCTPFEMFNFTHEPEYWNLFKVLIEAHNGLRNRVAERMNVTHMIELTWDVKLASMANNYLMTCIEYQTDPCTLHSHIIYENEVSEQFFSLNTTTPNIVQNSYTEKSSFYPYKFLERVIREWYFEKESMRAPMFRHEADGLVGRLLGENNFTHFTYPWCHRFGCAMAKYKGGYHVVCNYYPYYRTITNVVIFGGGTPVSNCPAHFPLNDQKFQNLCTQDVDDIIGVAVHEVKRNNLIILSCLITLWYWNV